MKKTLIAAALFAAVALPAMAQPYGPPGYYGPPPHAGEFWYGAPTRIEDRINFLDNRIQRMHVDGKLTPGQYFQYQRDMRDIRIKHDYLVRKDGPGLNPSDEAYLWHRIDGLSQKINWNARYGY